MDCFKLNHNFHGSQSYRCSKLLIKYALVCASRPLRYVSVINDNHLVSLMNFNEAKDN
jgi:hypothetical protein